MRLRIRWPCRRPCFGLPRSSVFSVAAGNGSSRRFESPSFSAAGCHAPSFPGSHATCRTFDAGSGSPLFLHLPALPATHLRGDSKVAPFGGADGTFPGCPVPRSFGIAEDQFRVAPQLHPPAPSDEPAESPRPFHPPASPERISGSPRIFFDLWLLRRSWPQFRPGASVLRRRRLTDPRFAPIHYPSADRPCFPQVAPASH